jgi:hypothetical protein
VILGVTNSWLETIAPTAGKKNSPKDLALGLFWEDLLPLFDPEVVIEARVEVKIVRSFLLGEDHVISCAHVQGQIVLEEMFDASTQVYSGLADVIVEVDAAPGS